MEESFLSSYLSDIGIGTGKEIMVKRQLCRNASYRRGSRRTNGCHSSATGLEGK